MANMIRRLLLLLIPVLLLLFCISICRAEVRIVQIEYTFSKPEDPNKQTTGFEFYQDGVKICETDNPNLRVFNCNFDTLPGTYDYQMAATFDDGTLSPKSPVYTFTIVPPEGTDPTKPLQPIIIRMIIGFTPQQ